MAELFISGGYDLVVKRKDKIQKKRDEPHGLTDPGECRPRRTKHHGRHKLEYLDMEALLCLNLLAEIITM